MSFWFDNLGLDLTVSREFLKFTTSLIYAMSCKKKCCCHHEIYLLEVGLKLHFRQGWFLSKDTVSWKVWLNWVLESFCKYFNQWKHSLAMLTVAVYCDWLKSIQKDKILIALPSAVRWNISRKHNGLNLKLIVKKCFFMIYSKIASWHINNHNWVKWQKCELPWIKFNLITFTKPYSLKKR